MNIDETKREFTVELDGKKMTGKWTKQLEDDLMDYHGTNAVDEITAAIKYEIERVRIAKEIDEKALREKSMQEKDDIPCVDLTDKYISHMKKTQQMRREIEAIVHPLLSDPMDMNGMYATTDKITKVFEKYYRT